MRFSPKRTQSLAVIVTCAVAIILLFVFVGYRIRRRVASDSASALLRRADELSWNGNWFSAAPLYRQPKIKFEAEGNRFKALYTQVTVRSPYLFRTFLCACYPPTARQEAPMSDHDRGRHQQVPEGIRDNSSDFPKDCSPAGCEPQQALKSLSVPFRLIVDFVVEPEAPAEFLQDTDTSPEERDLFLTILITPDALNRICRLVIVSKLTDDSRRYFEGKFLGPEWADILDCLLPSLSAEQQAFWTTLRREQSGRYDFCIDRIFQQFRGVLKTTEMRDVISGEAIPLRVNSRFGAAA